MFGEYKDEELDQSVPQSVQLRRHALELRERLLRTFPSEVTNGVLKEEEEEGEGGEVDDDEGLSSTVENDLLKESLKAKGTGTRRRKIPVRGGAKMMVKKAMQRNLNINWPETVRNTLLFLFFGYFGGRSQSSRTLLMAGAPLCFLLKLRFIKIYLKQVFYAVGKPPGILLSLLPAPQQAIMAFDMPRSLRDVYGIDTSTTVFGSRQVEEEEEEEESMTNYEDDDEEEESEEIEENAYDDDDDTEEEETDDEY